ncbi:hypothetical protein PROFUN_02580 [Planoprotostelium fungivorum]|uniref:Uncharacterized protein n=1 Tax=Planoprotostelium fungivorum TaxID=1890364 RepID=A0A2P6MPD8_9EUKA|nr:hypothetical protein PROFUN_02580 [Planoprotostelium fungivorum]
MLCRGRLLENMPLRGGGGKKSHLKEGTRSLMTLFPVPMYAIFLAYVTVIHTLLILGNVFVTCVTYHWNQRVLLIKVLLNKFSFIVYSLAFARFLSINGDGHCQTS